MTTILLCYWWRLKNYPKRQRNYQNESVSNLYKVIVSPSNTYSIWFIVLFSCDFSSFVLGKSTKNRWNVKKSHYNYLSISALFITSTEQVDKEEGNSDHKKKEFRNALGFYTKHIDVKCKDDLLNAIFYGNRATAHFVLGEFTRLFFFFGRERGSELKS